MYFSILKSLKAVLYNMCNNILKVYPKIGCLTAHHSPPQDRLLDTVLNRVSSENKNNNSMKLSFLLEKAY